MDIIKPNNDTRIYKYYILDNNIKCILINDTTLDKSHIVTSVNVGSFANKEYYDGIAHLLEHMCFITSKKYNKERLYLAKKVAEAGGHTNAFTAENNTIYYLDIFQENLEEILEIFIDFLTNAELKEEYILDELNNVDSEHQKNLFNDGWRLNNLEKILGDTNSNYNNFSTGSKTTLNKKDIHKKMVHFYNKYYVSNNISICIASKYDIDKLYKIVNKSFGLIKKSNINNTTKLIKPFYYTNRGKTFIMKLEGSSNILEYLFETPENIIKSKIFNLFIKIVCSPEDTLCLDHLKSLGYINLINGNYEIYGLVRIQLTLTNEGLDNILYINNFMCNFFNKILDLNWIDIFNTEKKRHLFLFNNLSKIDTLDLCTDFLMKLPIYNPENVYFSDYDYDSIDQSDIDMLKKCININNCIRILLTDKFNIPKNNKLLIDPNYKTKYYNSNIFDNFEKLNINIKYNSLNSYINIKPIFISGLNVKPKLIKNNYWYGGTSQFNENKIYYNIVFSKETYYNSPKNYLLTSISIQILNYYLYKKLYKAIEYNFNVQLNMDNNQNIIELNLYTLNDVKYMKTFINDIFDILFNKIEINNTFIESIISLKKNDLNNIKILNSWDYGDYIFNNSYKNSYDYLKLLKEINNITVIQVKNYIENLFNDTVNNIFIYGNIEEKDLPKFNKLNTNNKLYKFDKLSIKKNIIKIHPNKDEKTNSVQISYFIGKFDYIMNLHLIFLKLISYNIFFKDLRTTKKLGYLVQMYGSVISNEYYIYQKIQSELSCKEIINHIEIFNNNFIDKLKEEDFNKWKETVIKHLEMRETNMNELYNKYYDEINKRTYLFDRNKIMLKHINKVSLQSLINFVKEKLLNNKKINITQITHK